MPHKVGRFCYFTDIAERIRGLHEPRTQETQECTTRNQNGPLNYVKAGTRTHIELRNAGPELDLSIIWKLGPGPLTKNQVWPGSGQETQIEPSFSL